MHLPVELLWLAPLAAALLIGSFGVRRRIAGSRERRQDLLERRASLDVREVARDIAGDTLNVARVSEELVALADALHVAPGKLRAADVVADILGNEQFSGDDLLEAEVRLRRLRPDRVDKRLTVREMIGLLAQEAKK
jgi:hypothetical protein